MVVDTERELDTGETTASRATLLGGQAVPSARPLSLCEALQGSALEELTGREFAGEFMVDWTTPLGPRHPRSADAHRATAGRRRS